MSESVLAGGCHCGKVRYEARGAPFHEVLCHCVDCRRIAGAPAVAWFSVKRADFGFTAGEPKQHRSSARATRTFCPECGTPLTFVADTIPDEIDVTTVSLDDPEALPPKAHAYAGSRLSWDHLSEAIPVRP